MPKYSLTALQKHTRSIRRDSAAIIERYRQELARSVGMFDAFFTSLEQQQDQLRRNVRQILATKFFNHWYSAFLLAESGLHADAVSAERAALETLLFHWLVCVDPTAAKDYHEGDLPRPVVIRKRLEALGIEVAHLREVYASGSDVTHVSRASERFHLRWQGSGEGQLLLGGTFEGGDLEHWLHFLPSLLRMFPEPPPPTGVSRAGA